MVVNYNDIVNAIARAEDVALYNARARAIELSNGCKPSKEDDDKAIEIESWIQLLTRAKDNYDHETCITDDIIWEIIQNVNEQNREVDCDVSRTYSRHSSSGGGSYPPSGYVERVLGLYVDNTDPSNPIIRIYVNPATISGDGTQGSPFSAIGGGGGAVSSVNGLTGAVVLTTTNIAEGINLYYTNARGIASILTGLSVSGGAVIATDTILQAVGKLQNQINGLAGGVEYQGTWNASTNTPTLTSSVGTQGHYYVVSNAGSTNLNGITDWALGDWAIFNGTVWQKVDNTDAVVSVNGQTGIVALTTSDISEGTNQYFTTARVLATAITGFVSGAGAVAATDTILQAINKIVGNIAAKADLASPTFTGTVVMPTMNEAQGANIASASTTDIGAATGNYVVVTGTTTITALGTVQAGTRRIVNFSGILTLTHNATSLILPTGANITTAAGDTATFVSLGSGNWVCVNYMRASGAALAGGGASQDPIVSTGNGTAVTGTTSNSYTKGLLIPANSRGANQAPQIDVKVSKTGTSGTLTIRLYWNTFDDITTGSPILLGVSTALAASTRATSFMRIASIEVADGTGNGTLVSPVTVAGQQDYAAYTAVQTSAAIDWTAAGYLICAVQNGSTIDSSVCNMIKLH